jgi:hypothetical protein
VSTSGEGRIHGLAVYLNEEVADPSKPLVVIYNGEERYRGPVMPSLEAFLDAWALFPAYTPTLAKRIFTSRILLVDVKRVMETPSGDP